MAHIVNMQQVLRALLCDGGAWYRSCGPPEFHHLRQNLRFSKRICDEALKYIYFNNLRCVGFMTYAGAHSLAKGPYTAASQYANHINNIQPSLAREVCSLFVWYGCVGVNSYAVQIHQLRGQTVFTDAVVCEALYGDGYHDVKQVLCEWDDRLRPQSVSRSSTTVDTPPPKKRRRVGGISQEAERVLDVYPHLAEQLCPQDDSRDEDYTPPPSL